MRGVEDFEETLSQRMVSEVIGVRRFRSSRTLRECWHLPEEPTRARHPLGDASDGLSAKSDSDTSCPALAAPDRLWPPSESVRTSQAVDLFAFSRIGVSRLRT